MTYVDDTFPYGEYKGSGQLFETIAINEYNGDEFEDYQKITYQIDYSKELGMYRVTKFKDNHWDGDVVFDEYDSLGSDLIEGLNQAIEIESCDFCNKIYTEEEYQKMFDEDWWECQGTYLIKQKDQSINIFYACDDYYYNSDVVNNIKYCPKCGRRLQ